MDNGNRYLNPDKMNFWDRHLNLSLHVCGSATEDAMKGEWGKIDDLVNWNLTFFDRVQLNVANRKNNPEYVEKPQQSWLEVIIQQKNVDNLTLYQNTIEKYPEYDRFSTLLDASGGLGIDTPIQILETPRKVGYAGGFNPDNVGEKLRYLLENVKQGEFWIDMETGVRTQDWFDLHKVEWVLEICYNEIEQFKNKQ